MPESLNSVNNYFQDYICNWFGGEAISLALKYPHKKEFAAAGYAPFTWGGVEYGKISIDERVIRDKSSMSKL